jgi:hypothetical protein
MAISQDINQALIENVYQMYTNMEMQLLDTVAKQTKRGIVSGQVSQSLQDTQDTIGRMQAIINDGTKMAKASMSSGILNAYKQGVNSAEIDTLQDKLSVLDDLDIPVNIQMLMLSSIKVLNDSATRILRESEDVYRDVQASAASGLLAGVDTRMQASQKMLNDFAARGVTSFVDKAGRKWNMASYSEMCMRTVSQQAAREGHMSRAVELGYDLMKVSRIGTTCPICQQWQGVVLSISGKTPGYMTVESARAAGLFHPNCRHTLTSFDPELDGEGQTELNDVNKEVDHRNDILMSQRNNERQIRKWKRVEAASMDDKDKAYAHKKVQEWQEANRRLCSKHNLKRLYYREGNKVGASEGSRGPKISSKVKTGNNLIGDKPFTWKQLEGLSNAELNDVYNTLYGSMPKADMSVSAKRKLIHDKQAGATPKAKQPAVKKKETPNKPKAEVKTKPPIKQLSEEEQLLENVKKSVEGKSRDELFDDILNDLKKMGLSSMDLRMPIGDRNFNMKRAAIKVKYTKELAKKSISTTPLLEKDKLKTADDYFNTSKHVESHGTTNLMFEMPKDKLSEVNKRIKDAPAFYKDMWDVKGQTVYLHNTDLAETKFAGKVVKSEQAFYSPSTNVCYLSMNTSEISKMGKFSSFFHETGHSFDYNMGEISKNKQFINALKEDTRILTNDSARRASLHMDDTTAGIQDIYHGVTGKSIKYGHGKKLDGSDYWGQMGTVERDNMVACEAFANISSAFSSKDILTKMMAHYPNATYEYYKLVKTATDEAKIGVEFKKLYKKVKI